MTAVLHTKNWRGTYVAFLSPNDRGTLDRDWMPVTVKATKKHPMRTYGNLPQGWFEVREGYRTYRGELTPKTYHRCDGVTVTAVSFDDMARALEGPLPGEPGEWGSDRCECGGTVEVFTVDGFPKCSAHAPDEVPAMVDTPEALEAVMPL